MLMVDESENRKLNIDLRGRNVVLQSNKEEFI
jgi:hypothetical protein